jgi:hypothetical protein
MDGPVMESPRHARGVPDAREEASLNEYPLLFTTRELVAGNGFLAFVDGCGQLLLVRESNAEWWMYGVQPGGIGEGGTTLGEANLRFVGSVKNVLAEIADEAKSFTEFERAVKDFFSQVDGTDRQRWEAARAALLAGAAVDDPWVSALKREPVLKDCRVQVSRINVPATEAKPDMNSGAESRIALAAAA